MALFLYDKPSLAQTVDKPQFCREIGGAYNPKEETCTLEKRSDGVQPSCFREAAKHVFADDNGACYDFMRLDEGKYRQRYRLTDKCFNKLPTFQKMVTSERSGMCEDTAAWVNAAGSFLPKEEGTVGPGDDKDPRHCRAHRSASRCEADMCEWSSSNTYVKCEAGQDCQTTCRTMGGDMVDGECVIPKCRPKVASELPCNEPI
tara:strand:- start:381 stop:989 length:609 start_codon:yes stop_codon:yes gene_type:complete